MILCKKPPTKPGQVIVSLVDGRVWARGVWTGRMAENSHVVEIKYHPDDGYWQQRRLAPNAIEPAGWLEVWLFRDNPYSEKRTLRDGEGAAR